MVRGGWGVGVGARFLEPRLNGGGRLAAAGVGATATAALHLLHDVHKNGPGTPVIFLSDHVDEATVEAALKAGATDVQPRGVEEASVARSIRYAIDVYCKERQRQKAEDTLRKLSRAVEQSADLVIITDRTGVIEYINPAFEALTGYSPQEVIGQTPRILKSGQQTSELYEEQWRTILSGNVFRGTMINRKKNGDVFVAEKTVTPLRDNDGKVTHFISNDRDITERRRLEIQLQQAQKMDAIGRLAGGVAHDFNNLLMVSSSYAELMLDSLAAHIVGREDPNQDPDSQLRRRGQSHPCAGRSNSGSGGALRRADAAPLDLQPESDPPAEGAEPECRCPSNREDASPFNRRKHHSCEQA